jgi:hypothetical protein
MSSHALHAIALVGPRRSVRVHFVVLRKDSVTAYKLRAVHSLSGLAPRGSLISFTYLSGAQINGNFTRHAKEISIRERQR